MSTKHHHINPVSKQPLTHNYITHTKSTMPSLISSLQYLKVRRWEPELIGPAKPTPCEEKKLSDIDSQESYRFQVPFAMFYPNNPLNEGEIDPVKVIREALGKALVPYYPFAGRLIEGPKQKLIVDCDGQGVLFIEAEADVTLDQLGDTIQPPCPFLDEFLHQVPGSEGITGCPLLLIQVTRLLCGGFVFAVRLNHTMADSLGLAQFLKAVAEFARGATELSVSPVWERHILNARDPPRITCTHNEYDLETNNKAYQIMEENHNMINESFYFGPKEINAIRKHVQERCTTFELLTACLWKCRTVALEFDPEEIVRLSITVNLRGKKHQNLHIPSGYYGNGFGFPAVTSKAGLVCENSLGYVVELVKKGKSEMSEEYIKSVADLMEIKGQPGLVLNGNFIVSDNTRVGFGEIDFGWGKALCAGPANALTLISFYSQYRSRGEEGIAVPICLPEFAMERFCQELKRMTGKP